jgi:CRISPR type I-E-associated protein CasB/Cse2
MSDPAKEEERDEGVIAQEWWQEYCHPDNGDRAVRAKLRRCKDWRQAMMIPAAHILMRELHIKNDENNPKIAPKRVEAALHLAIVLAHVKEDDTTSLMRSVGFKTLPPKGITPDEPPKLAVMRFTRLTRSDNKNLPLALIRLVRLMDNQKASITELTDAVLNWSHPWRGDHIRRKWAFDYYAASSANPDVSSSSPAPDQESLSS